MTPKDPDETHAETAADALDTLAARALATPPLPTETRARLRAVVREEARRVRVGLAEASLHAGFAVGALVWAAVAAFG